MYGLCRFRECHKVCGDDDLLGIGVVPFFDQAGAGTDNVEADGLRSGELHGDTHGEALPLGRLADGIGVAGLGPLGERTKNDGAAGSELGDDRDQAAFGCGADAAVGGIVTEPDRTGDGGVEVGKMECGYVTRYAVDHEPRAGLPDPVCGTVCRKRVVEPQRATYCEAAIGDLVSVARRPLLLTTVDDERTNLKRGGVLIFGIGGCVRRSVGDLADGSEADGVDFWSRSGAEVPGGGGGKEKQREQRQESRTEGLHGGEGRKSAIRMQ